MERLYHSVQYIYLDELDNRASKDLRPNGFAEATKVKDLL